MSESLLDKINSPADIKNYSRDEIDQLCAEIRERLIETVAQNGGHLASNLGVVELTVAMHRVFDSPHDLMISLCLTSDINAILTSCLQGAGNNSVPCGQKAECPDSLSRPRASMTL